MKTSLVTTVWTTTTEPYIQLPPDRIEVRYSPESGMLFLPKATEIQAKHPNSWEKLLRNGIHFMADPPQLDAPLLRVLREKIGVRVETDDVALFASLLNLEQGDPAFRV